jgi:hypothetical protein
MNQPFRPASNRSRATSALAAVLASTLILSAVLGPADHYGSQPQLAAAPALASGQYRSGMTLNG